MFCVAAPLIFRASNLPFSERRRKWCGGMAPYPSGNKSHTECDIEILRIGKIAKSKTIYIIHLRPIICQQRSISCRHPAVCVRVWRDRNEKWKMIAPNSDTYFYSWFDYIFECRQINMRHHDQCLHNFRQFSLLKSSQFAIIKICLQNFIIGVKT